MAYTPRVVKDRIIQYPHRYQMTLINGTTYDLVPITGIVTEGGTPINKVYLQQLEDELGKAIQINDLSNLIIKYGVASGINSYIVSIPRVTSLLTGLEVTVKFTNSSSGVITLNVNGLGVKNIVSAGGIPQINANGVYSLLYDGVSFQLLGEKVFKTITSSIEPILNIGDQWHKEI